MHRKLLRKGVDYVSIPKEDVIREGGFKGVYTIFMKDLCRIIDREGKGYDISQ